jgi:hypothetical protein
MRCSERRGGKLADEQQHHQGLEEGGNVHASSSVLRTSNRSFPRIRRQP